MRNENDSECLVGRRGIPRRALLRAGGGLAALTVKDDHLFIEAGGFNNTNPVGWKPPLIVMKRAGK